MHYVEYKKINGTGLGWCLDKPATREEWAGYQKVLDEKAKTCTSRPYGGIRNMFHRMSYEAYLHEWNMDHGPRSS